MKAVLLRACSAVLLALVSLGASAFNLQFASDVPLAHFTDADRSAHEAMLTQLLDNAPDGKHLSWSNPDNRSGGDGVARKTSDRAGKRCRDLQIKTYYRALRATNAMRACRGEDGKWALEN